MELCQLDSERQAPSRDSVIPSVQQQQQNEPTLPRRDNHTPSCLVCQRRKVKCNRVYPCAACLKTGLQCEFKPEDVPGPVIHQDVREHSRHEFNAIPDNDTPPKTSPYAGQNQSWHPRPSPMASPTHSRGVSGTTIHKSAVSLGTGLANDAGRDVPYTPAPPAPNNRHFIFATAQQDTFGSGQSARPPPPAHYVVQLWQTYLTHVDPVLKVLHAPTLQQTVLGQIGKPSLPAGLQALTSAIYFLSTVSLQDDECQALLQVSKAELLLTYRLATEEALSAAAFVTTTDIQVLQGLMLYLTALQSLGETSTVWSLIGLASRIAYTLDLTSRDNATKLSSFETEIRHRLWWTLVLLDHCNSEAMGKSSSLLKQKRDVKLPANLNDTQLFPTMLRLPESKPTATDISYVLLQATIASHTTSNATKTPAFNTSPSSKAHTQIRDLEYHLEEEILRFCDPSVPIQAYTLNTAHTTLTQLRVKEEESKLHLPTEQFSPIAFSLSTKQVDLYLDLDKTPELQRWKWHWCSSFPFSALKQLIHQLHLHPNLDTGSPELTAAETKIQEIVDTVLPTLDLGPRKAMAVDSMREILAPTSSQHPPPEFSIPMDSPLLLLTGQKAKTASLAAVEPKGQAEDRGPAASTARTSRRVYNGMGYAHGSRPFAALLPGMGSSSLEKGEKEGAEGEGAAGDGVQSRPGNGIDWGEMERLAGELCAV